MKAAPQREAGLEGLYRSYWGEVCGYIRNKFGAGPPDPEDIAQTAFTKLAMVKNPETLRNPRAFLYTTVRNEVIEYHRRVSRRRPIDEDLAREADAESLSEFDAERVFIGREQLEIVVAALKKLPERQSRLFLLSRVEGLSIDEIAQREGMTNAAVQKQIERALAKCLWALDRANQPAGSTGGKWK